METLSALLALCEGFTSGHRWLPLTKPVTRNFHVILCTPVQSIETPVISDAIAFIMMSLQWGMLKTYDVFQILCTLLLRFVVVCYRLLLLSQCSKVIMSAMASQITGVSMVCSTVCSGVDRRKYKSSVSLVLWGEFTGDRWIPLTKGQ